LLFFGSYFKLQIGQVLAAGVAVRLLFKARYHPHDKKKQQGQDYRYKRQALYD
jgi:hypothetical protein